jgi:hypothetical protein
MGLEITASRLKGCKDSIGGVKKVYLFAFEKHARSLIVVEDMVLTSFPETDIYPFEAVNDPNFTNNGEENEGGKFYNEGLDLSFKGIFVYDEFEIFLKKDLRCIIEDRNGKLRMLGLRNGLIVERLNRTTGDAKNSLSGYTFNLQGQEENIAPFLNNLDDFNIIPNDFLLLEDGEFALTEDNKLIRLE